MIKGEPVPGVLAEAVVDTRRPNKAEITVYGTLFTSRRGVASSVNHKLSHNILTLDDAVPEASGAQKNDLKHLEPYGYLGYGWKGIDVANSIPARQKTGTVLNDAYTCTLGFGGC